VSGQLTVEGLKNLNGSRIGISNPVLNLRAEDSDTNMLANPRIRVKNRDKAKIHIGDKVPVITSTSTSTGFVAESVNYLDVGLKLDVEPSIHLDDEVDMKVGLEVSNIVREIKSANGTLTYQVGTRNASTTLRLRDGETQALAGLINDEDRKSANKVPGLGDIPVLGHLFSSHRDDRSKTEIVLLITPHIVRNLSRPEAIVAEFMSGTDAAIGSPQMGLRTAAPPPPEPPTVPPAPLAAPQFVPQLSPAVRVPLPATQ
jgi:general secretion pathway protein D